MSRLDSSQFSTTENSRTFLTKSKVIEVAQQIAYRFLGIFFLGFSLWSLLNQNKKLKILKNTDLSSGFKNNINGISEYRPPNKIKKDLVKSIKKLMFSESLNIAINLAVTASVIITLIIGGAGAVLISIVGAAAATVKIVYDYHVEDEQKDLKIELFRSKVLNKMTQGELDIYNTLVPEAQIHFLAKKAVKSGFLDNEVKDYALNRRQGRFENAKLRNFRFFLAIAGIGLGVAFTILTAGTVAKIAIFVLTLASTTVAICEIPVIKKFIVKKGVDEFFRTGVHKFRKLLIKNGRTVDKFDYINLSVNIYLKNLRNDSVISFDDIQNLKSRRPTKQTSSSLVGVLSSLKSPQTLEMKNVAKQSPQQSSKPFVIRDLSKKSISQNSEHRQENTPRL